MPRDKLPLSFVIPKLVRRMAKLLPPAPMTPEPSPRLVLEEGEGLWGNLLLSRCPAPGVEKGKGSFPGDGQGPKPPTFMWTVFGQKGYEQGNETNKPPGSWGSFSAEGFLPSDFP